MITKTISPLKRLEKLIVSGSGSVEEKPIQYD